MQARNITSDAMRLFVLIVAIVPLLDAGYCSILDCVAVHLTGFDAGHKYAS